MDPADALFQNVDNAAEAENYMQHVNGIVQKVEQLEKQVEEVDEFFSNLSKKQLNASKGSSNGKDADRGRQIPNVKKQHQDAELREAAPVKRMQDLMRQFGTIFRQITQLKWAEPFQNPVDVKGLGLHDYYEIIKKPMDFSTIKNRMEAKDGTGYKHVREIYADVRLVFTNAIEYNGAKHDVSIMAKTLLEKFEEKWLQLLPKVLEEEERLKEEEAQAELEIELAQEAAHAKMARDISTELSEVDKYLEGIREAVLQKCRKTTTGEKRKLGAALAKLSHEDLSKALEIVAQDNPGFQASAEEVDLDMDALSESTLWRLKFFIHNALEVQGRSPASMSGNNTSSIAAVTNDATSNANNNKRKKRAV